MTARKRETYFLFFLLCLAGILFIALLLIHFSSPRENNYAEENSALRESSFPQENTTSEETSIYEENSEPSENSQIQESSIPQENSRIQESSAPQENSKIQETSVSSVSQTDWNLILVNRNHPLPEDFTITTKKISSEEEVDERIYGALMKMLSDARDEGLSPVVCSSYRTTEVQTILYNRKIQRLLDAGYSSEEAPGLLPNLWPFRVPVNTTQA